MSRLATRFDHWSLVLDTTTRATTDGAFVRLRPSPATSTPTRGSHNDVICRLPHLTSPAEVCPEDAGVADVPFPRVHLRRLRDTTDINGPFNSGRTEKQRGLTSRVDQMVVFGPPPLGHTASVHPPLG
jgi:hypothetical protein